MMRPSPCRLLLVAALAACSLAPTDAAWATSLLAGADMAVPLVVGDCPWLDSAVLCGCRSSTANIKTHNMFGSYTGPRLTLDDSRTNFRGGSYCVPPSKEGRNIYPDKTGTIQVGNSDKTYKTGVDVDIFYQVLTDAGDEVLDCWVKVLMNNAFIGTNEFTVSLSGNGCPANLKTEMGDIIPGTIDSGRDLYVYLDGVKPATGTASSIGNLGLAPDAAPAINAALAGTEDASAGMAAAPASAGSVAAVFSAAALAVAAAGLL